ncbi:MAG: MFS transporter, partial [Rubrivivax sp.]
LGGVVFQARGDYTLMWLMDIALAAGAALVHLPIREPVPAGRVAMAA